MIVSTTLVSNVLDVADGAVVVGGGGVSATPLVGILPAKTGTDISPVRAIANTKRFIFESPFAIEDATVVVSKIAKAQKLLRTGGSGG